MSPFIGPCSNVVRPGHYRTLDYMDTSEFLEVKALFEAYPEIGSVYFRPTDKALTVVDLHASSPKPRIGVGEDPYVTVGTTAQHLRPTMPQRILYLEAVRARQKKKSVENQFEAYLIREAQAHSLRLPGFPERLRFIHSQWRMDLPRGGRQQFTDLTAVDLPSRSLVLIELKAAPDTSAYAQAQEYLEYFRSHGDELRPFFARVAQVMGNLYDCPQLAALNEVCDPAAALIAWPGALRTIQVLGLEQLDGLV